MNEQEALTIAQALRDSDKSLAEVAGALHENGTGLDISQVVRVLCSGLNLDANHIAQALYDEKGLNLDIDQIAEALYRSRCLDLSADGVAAVLYRMEGLDLDEAEVIHALDRLGFTAIQIAQILHSENGLNLNAKQIAQALYDADDLGDSSIQNIAWILCEGLGLGAESVQQILVEIGIVASEHK